MAPQTDDAFAVHLAEGAGQVLLRLRAEMGFGDPTALRAAGDKQAHNWITTERAAHRPADAVLSEEGERHDPRRLDADRVWIVDPLDGTREFGEEGREDWAVHIALWERGSAAPSQIIAAAITMPAASRTLSTADRPPYPARKPGRMRFVASRTRPPALLIAVAEAMDAEIVPMGSAGAKIAAVILGDVDAYVHAGGQWEWDNAAPVGVAFATGLHASRIDGSSLDYNGADPKLPDLVVCRPDLAEGILAAISRVE
jgi:3'(2'), 5'-bisphosphate nucleotidase